MPEPTAAHAPPEPRAPSPWPRVVVVCATLASLTTCSVVAQRPAPACKPAPVAKSTPRARPRDAAATTPRAYDDVRPVNPVSAHEGVTVPPQLPY